MSARIVVPEEVSAGQQAARELDKRRREVVDALIEHHYKPGLITVEDLAIELVSVLAEIR